MHKFDPDVYSESVFELGKKVKYFQKGHAYSHTFEYIGPIEGYRQGNRINGNNAFRKAERKASSALPEIYANAPKELSIEEQLKQTQLKLERENARALHAEGLVNEYFY